MPALGHWLSPCVLLPFSPPLTPCACLIPLYLPGPPSRATHLFIGPLLSKRCLCSAKRGLLLHAARVCGTNPAPLVLRSPFWGLLCLLALFILLLLLPDALRWMGRDVWLSQQPSCPLPPKLPLAMPKDPVPVPVPPSPPFASEPVSSLPPRLPCQALTLDGSPIQNAWAPLSKRPGPFELKGFSQRLSSNVWPLFIYHPAMYYSFI